jgi:MFS family permease
MTQHLRQKKASPLAGVIFFGLLACLLYGLGAGLRANIGLFLKPLAKQCGTSYAAVSFCIAVMQLVFGASQPVFGVLAGRRGNRRVLLAGAALMGAGLFGMALARSAAALFIALSLLFGLGAGAIAFGLVLSSAIWFAGERFSMLLSGMLNAAAGMCGFVLSPSIEALMGAGGVALAAHTLLIPVACLIPLSVFVTSKDPKPASIASAEEPISFGTIRDAFGNRTFRLLVCGFSTCGFHMVIIESHLFSQFVSYGIPSQTAGWVFSVYSLATITGALLSGFLSTRLPKGRLLCFYYGFRALWALLYLFTMPKNAVTAIAFAAGLGMTGDATVSPTSGLVSAHFDHTQVAALVGTLFLFHQVGAFFSAWLGGVLLKATGGYTALWVLDMALCTFAALASFGIGKEA